MDIALSDDLYEEIGIAMTNPKTKSEPLPLAFITLVI
jgi:hypothetical protein|tara:strand:+ start:1080 stop:1190 length:111 start_codon:yes stop_codon:yes gene_type:complete